MTGVATVIVQGGQEPEFQITPRSGEAAGAAGHRDRHPGCGEGHQPDRFSRTDRAQSSTRARPGERAGAQRRAIWRISSSRTRRPGVPVRIGDVAAVQQSVKPLYTIVPANGKPAVLLNINRQPDSNTVAVANEVHAEVDRIRSTLPPECRSQPFYDQSGLVQDSIKSVRDAILLGLILSAIVLVVFLRDWGSSVVAGLVIPVTIFITFIVLKLLGQSFNLMTLGGLAAAVGLVIDDAIVVVENIVLHRDAGRRQD